MAGISYIFADRFSRLVEVATFLIVLILSPI